MQAHFSLSCQSKYTFLDGLELVKINLVMGDHIAHIAPEPWHKADWLTSPSCAEPYENRIFPQPLPTCLPDFWNSHYLLWVWKGIFVPIGYNCDSDDLLAWLIMENLFLHELKAFSYSAH